MPKPDYSKINDEILRDEFNKREEGDNLEVWEDDIDTWLDDDRWVVPHDEIEGETGEFDEEGYWIYY